jgi:cathepsin L
MVTPVRDQGTCLGSWAAASAAALETAAAVAGAPLERLSVQRLLDCVMTPAPGSAVNSRGCGGGWPLTALSHVKDMEPGGMLPLEEAVPYFEVTGACTAVAMAAAAAVAKNTSTTTARGGQVRLKQVALVPQGDEEAVAAAVAEHGAVVVTIQAMDDFWLYGGGLYSNPECTGRSLDHHLVVVGFTPDAWIAKAALGAAWGEGGYIRLARGQNMCGLAEWAVVPVVG